MKLWIRTRLMVYLAHDMLFSIWLRQRVGRWAQILFELVDIFPCLLFTVPYRIVGGDVMEIAAYARDNTGREDARLYIGRMMREYKDANIKLAQAKKDLRDARENFYRGDN